MRRGREVEVQRGSERADKLAIVGARLPEAEAEEETDEDWERLRTEAELRLEAGGSVEAD